MSILSLSHQCSVFFLNPRPTELEQVSLDIKKVIGGTPSTTMLPLPPDAPKDIPRLIIEADSMKIEVSLIKISMTYKSKEMLASTTENILNSCGSIKNRKFSRIGLIHQYFISEEEIDSLDVFSKRIKSDETIIEKSFRIVKETQINDKLSNIVQECRNGSIEKDDSKRPGYICTTDVNTSHKEKLELTGQQIATFVSIFSAQIDSNSILEI